MQIDLTPSQCEDILERNHYGHLGCVDNGQPYVLPITYVYDSGTFYAFSLTGRKIDIMRKHPSICIQVERIVSEREWESVLCFGEYEEVTDPGEAKQIRLRLAELHGDALWNGVEPPVMPAVVQSGQRNIEESITYRMKPVHMTGRAEKA
ncbi:pyridoxamine 5'-phosphate oxidase family protein [Candidatus Peribacteria bacterium]|nr:MAG: pyridoxamine 5'-phosphate oxidase family protein [Candidatus Peribacteria bacterium]